MVAFERLQRVPAALGIAADAAVGKGTARTTKMADKESRHGKDAPSSESLRRYLRYGLSLPERTLRSTAGVVGGTLRESATMLLPQMFRNAKTYQTFVGQMLDFMAEDMGGVERSRHPGVDAKVENYVARKTVGNFVELASLATIHLSPMFVLALVGDVAYGSQAYLRELAEELQQRGVIEDAAAIGKVDDLLDAAASASHKTATMFDTPPLSVGGLRATVEQTRQALAELDPAKVLSPRELERLWNGIQSAARRQGVSPLRISGAMTLLSLDKVGKLGSGSLSTVRVAGRLFNRHVLEHYRLVLAQIDDTGLYPALAASSKPYAEAVWRNFAADRPTITEEVLSGGAGRAWDKARRWLRSARGRARAL